MLNKWYFISLGTATALTSIGLAMRSCATNKVDNVFGATWCTQDLNAVTQSTFSVNGALHCGGCYVAALGLVIAGVSVFQLLLAVMNSNKCSKRITAFS